MVHRLDSEAQLARARVEAIGQEMPLGLRQVAQRSDVSRAVVSQNDVALRELLFAVARTSGSRRPHRLRQESGRVMGANTGNNLLAINNYIRGTDFGTKLLRILETIRAPPPRFGDTGELDAEFSRILNLPEPAVVAHFAFEPVFDDFGDLIGALGGDPHVGRARTHAGEFHVFVKCRRDDLARYRRRVRRGSGRGQAFKSGTIAGRAYSIRRR